MHKERNDGFTLDLYWHSFLLGKLHRVGEDWLYEHRPDVMMPFSELKVRSDGLPYFIESMLPERLAFAESAMYGDRLLRDMQTRFLSSIQLVPENKKPFSLQDKIEGRIASFAPPGMDFSGNTVGFPRSLVTHDGDQISPEVISLVYDSMIPRISGCQIKIPAYLSSAGELMPAINKPFTHIVKVPGAFPPYDMMTALEWYASALIKTAGVQTEEFGTATSDIGGLFIAERFDISDNEETVYYCEDMSAIFGVPQSEKYNADMLDVGHALMSLSTNPRADAMELIRQCTASWLVVNSDLHLKNLSLLKRSNAEMDGFESIRLAPAYDVVACSELTSETDMALPIAGNTTYSADTLLRLAEGMGRANRAARLERNEVLGEIYRVAEIINTLAPMISAYLPASFRHGSTKDIVAASARSISKRCRSMMHDIDNGIMRKSALKL